MCLRVDRRVVARGGGAVQKFNSPEPVEGIILIHTTVCDGRWDGSAHHLVLFILPGNITFALAASIG